MIEKNLLKTLRGESTYPRPVWMMRQAGRYLPEYREIRKTYRHFMDFVMSPDDAATVTLQPVTRFGMDAAILFSDILTIPAALGQNVTFVEKEGPQLAPLITTEHAIEQLCTRPNTLFPVYETVRQCQKLLNSQAPDAALIGFAGGAWTVACYMVCGNGKDKSFAGIMQMRQNAPELLQALFKKITDATSDYLCQQAEAGAEVLQIFDSWAGILKDERDFHHFITEPTTRIIKKVRERFSSIPFIGFPKSPHFPIEDYIRETGINAIGLGQDVDIVDLLPYVPENIAIQGNLDPALVVHGGENMKNSVQRILDICRGRPHVFNLGHGLTPDTPPDHVRDIVRLVKDYR